MNAAVRLRRIGASPAAPCSAPATPAVPCSARRARFLTWLTLCALPEAAGLRQVRYQQNRREGRRHDDVTYDFDTWPDLPAFPEVKGPSEEAVRNAAADLGLDYSEARFGSVHLIYKSEGNRDILAEPTLLFRAQ